MLGHGYIQINGMTIPNPVEFSVEYDNNETQATSEAGTLLVSVTRLKRRNISLKCQVTSIWRDKLLTLAGQTSATLTLQGENITGRLRVSSDALAGGSEFVANTSGLWTMQLTFIEN